MFIEIKNKKQNTLQLPKHYYLIPRHASNLKAIGDASFQTLINMFMQEPHRFTTKRERVTKQRN